MAGSVFDGIDESDPCAVWPVLQSAYSRLLAGEMVVEARFGPDTTRFQQADRSALAQEIARLKAECAAKQGRRRTRFAKSIRFNSY